MQSQQTGSTRNAPGACARLLVFFKLVSCKDSRSTVSASAAMEPHGRSDLAPSIAQSPRRGALAERGNADAALDVSSSRRSRPSTVVAGSRRESRFRGFASPPPTHPRRAMRRGVRRSRDVARHAMPTSAARRRRRAIAAGHPGVAALRSARDAHAMIELALAGGGGVPAAEGARHGVRAVVL
jgi:hypothetical protein